MCRLCHQSGHIRNAVDVPHENNFPYHCSKPRYRMGLYIETKSIGRALGTRIICIEIMEYSLCYYLCLFYAWMNNIYLIDEPLVCFCFIDFSSLRYPKGRIIYCPGPSFWHQFHLRQFSILYPRSPLSLFLKRNIHIVLSCCLWVVANIPPFLAIFNQKDTMIIVIHFTKRNRMLSFL